MASIADEVKKLMDKDKYASIIDSIMSNEEIQKFISDNNMQETKIKRSYPKFFEYLHPNKVFDGFTSKLIYHNGYADVIYSEIEESIKQKKANRAIKNLESSSFVLDPTIKEATFEKFNIETDEEKKAYDFSINLAKYYRDGGQGNAFMSGPPGSGKSHLSMSILKSFLESGDKTALFVSYAYIVSLIQDSFSNRDSNYSRNNVFQILKNVDLLVIDDVGSEVTTPFSESLLESVVDSRNNTIITTNLSSDALRGNATKKGRYNPRTASRMFKAIGKKAFNFKNIKDKRVLPF